LIRASVQTSLCFSLFVYVFVGMLSRAYVLVLSLKFVRLCMCVCMCVCLCFCIFLNLCVCTYLYAKTCMCMWMVFCTRKPSTTSKLVYKTSYETNGAMLDSCRSATSARPSAVGHLSVRPDHRHVKRLRMWLFCHVYVGLLFARAHLDSERIQASWVTTCLCMQYASQMRQCTLLQSYQTESRTRTRTRASTHTHTHTHTHTRWRMTAHVYTHKHTHTQELKKGQQYCFGMFVCWCVCGFTCCVCL
jgi:hypothetical protein